MRLSRLGLAYGFGAYALWGALPFYFGLIIAVGPYEIVPWRVLLTLAFCVVVISLTRAWPDIRRIVRNRRLIWRLVFSAFFLYANWQIFVIGVMSGRVLETSLGYFINPLFTILLGVFVRKDVLSRLQWIAVSIAALGVLAAAIGYGKFPWIALGLATSFACYGAIHQELGNAVGGVAGLTVESILTMPLAVAQGIFLAFTVGLTAFSHSPSITILVLLSGIMTAVPLVFFGEAAARLPLAYLGFLQFLTPVITFLYGHFILGEEMSLTRWIGFIGVWVALTLLIFDIVRRIRKNPGGDPVGLHTGPIPLD